ncbi:MAG TPA: carboxypeptidase regulatory-like domain-containing protein, partial [Fibrobacteraceae bacterium]|nr:carboxypeptidase regulatory-like domain-containing protein [Fibrobacteraceae bacterium]
MVQKILIPTIFLLFVACSQSDKNFGDSDSDEFTGTVSGVEFRKAGYRDTALSKGFEVGLLDSVDVGTQRMKYRYATIKGTVKDASGSIVTAAGITVEDQTASGMAGESGTYTLSQVEPGYVRVLAAYSGKGYGIKKMTVVADSIYTDVGVELESEGGTVSGVVVDEDGNPVEGAIVTALGGALCDTTDENGNYTFSSVPSGVSVIVTVSIEDAEVATVSTNVSEGDSVEAATVTATAIDTDAVLHVLPS